MKFGIRKFTPRQRISSRVSAKRILAHRGGLKMPRGFGAVRNPRKAIYNKVYNRTTISTENALSSPLLLVAVVAAVMLPCVSIPLLVLYLLAK